MLKNNINEVIHDHNVVDEKSPIIKRDKDSHNLSRGRRNFMHELLLERSEEQLILVLLLEKRSKGNEEMGIVEHEANIFDNVLAVGSDGHKQNP